MAWNPSESPDPNKLTEEHKDVLIAIGLVYNGGLFRFSDKQYQLGVTNLPSLEIILQAVLDDEVDKNTRQQAGQDLLNSAWTRSERILHKTIPWAPTQAARDFIDDNYAGIYDQYLPSHLSTTPGHGLVGDPDETLTHRNGVEVGGRSLLNDNHFSKVKWYPTEHGQAGPDLLAYHIVDDEWWYVEVLTQYASTEHYENKIKQMVDQDRSVYLIADNRTTLNKCLNEGVKADDVSLDIKNFPLDNPGDRAVTKVSEYLTKSRMELGYDPGPIHRVDTINRLHRIRTPDFLE